jgi:DNA-binding Lrp family transcriptional regulator
MEPVRLPRFVRAKLNSVLRLTTRDSEIIRHVFTYRFLRSAQIHKLIGGSRQQLLRRLQRLYHHGFLDRPRAQIDYYQRGSRAMVYGVGNQGVKLLENKFSVPRRKVDWTAKNRSANRYFLEHTLEVAEVMIAFELACRRHGQMELVNHTEEALHWTVQIRHRATTLAIGVVPDRVFGLRRIDAPRNIAWFFLEVDRATMPVERHGLKQTSFARKLIAYHATWEQRVLKAFSRFRVLTVTTSAERVDHLVEVCGRLDSGQGLFLFADKKSLNAHGDILSLPWKTGKAGTVETLT